MVFYMVDLTSRDDEKSREIAKETGRIEEQNLQRERSMAKETGRRQGQEEERAREKPKAGSGKWVMAVLWLIVLACIIVVAGLLTLSVSVTDVTPGNSLPFTTNYGVSFPEGQTIAIGNSHISVLSYQNELTSDIDGDKQKLVIGESRVIAERRAVITTLGLLTLMDTNFRINLVYKGDRDNRAYFDMAVQTSKQVPDMLLKNLLPAAIDARPI
jgi:general stress protein YciG